jgi:hypothetical protein
MRWMKKAEDEGKEFTQEMFDSIDWAPLESEIEKTVGTKVTLEKTRVKSRSEGYYVKIKSQNLADKSGVLSSVFKEVQIDNFGGSYNFEKDYLWVLVHFSWEHKGGGSNGTELFTAWYEFKTKTWQFRHLGK